jgi:hypothetical protein
VDSKGSHIGRARAVVLTAVIGMAALGGPALWGLGEQADPWAVALGSGSGGAVAVWILAVMQMARRGRLGRRARTSPAVIMAVAAAGVLARPAVGLLGVDGRFIVYAVLAGLVAGIGASVVRATVADVVAPLGTSSRR